MGKKDYQSHSDLELLEAYIKKDDKEAVTILYDRYIHLVYGVSLKYLKDREKAEDATMALFEKLLIQLKQQSITSFRSWLYATAKNHCLMILRGKTFHKTEIENVLFMESAEELHPLDRDLEGIYEILEKCIKELKQQQRSCIELFYYKKNNYEEIVALTGYELKKVKSYLQNGKRNLKICMEHNGQKIQS